MVMRSSATDGRSAPECQGKWPDQTLKRHSDAQNGDSRPATWQLGFQPVQKMPIVHVSLGFIRGIPVNNILQLSLPDLENRAAARVQEHFAALGPGSEEWVSDGMHRIEQNLFPFCAQDLKASPLIDHYRAYFSEAYAGLKAIIADEIASIEKQHGGDVPAAFERAVRVAVERREFLATLHSRT
jgi:hypothetical protein